MKLSVISRKLHRWGAILVAIPTLLVFLTGVVLQVKKQAPFIQPPTQRGTAGDPQLSFSDILRIARSVPEARIRTWEDVDRLDVRPERAIVKVRSRKYWEVQIDLVSGRVLSSLSRRSDWIEALHDGSWFHDRAKLWVFLPNGLLLLGLWLTGVYLWGWPIFMRRRNRRRRRQRQQVQSDTEAAGSH